MRTSGSAAVLLLLLAGCDRCGGSGASSGPARPAKTEVEIVTAAGSAPLALDAKTQDAVRAHVEHVLEICNFRSDKHAVPFKGMDLGAIWSERASGPHLSIRYPAPHAFKAIAGELSASDVMLAMSTATGPEPALVREDGKVIGLEMCGYDDRTLSCAVPELAKLLPPPGPCPPLLGK